jgi:hypothetical protein
MKSRLRGLLGSLVILASAPVLAESDGEALFREISAEMARHEAAHDVADLMTTIRKTIAAAELRSLEHHRWTITQHPGLFYDVTGLEQGQHPYHATGDWDCDGEPDQAVLLQQPKSQVAVVLVVDVDGKKLVAHQTSD